MKIGTTSAIIFTFTILILPITSNVYDSYTVQFVKERGISDCQRIFCKCSAMNYFYEKSPVPLKSGILQYGCDGNDYLISFASGTMEDAWSTCCNLDMVPATIRTSEEMQCVQNLFRNFSDYVQHELFRVAYIDHSLEGKFMACPNYVEIGSTLWAPMEPDNYRNQEACSALQLMPVLGHFDIPCFRSYRVLCQSVKSVNFHPTTPATTVSSVTLGPLSHRSVTRNPAREAPYITSIIEKKTCREIMCPPKKNVIINGTWQVSNGTGVVAAICGQKHFFVSNTKTKINPGQIWSKCCALGGVPAFFDSATEMKCFIQQYRAMPGTFRGNVQWDPFVIGARDLNLKRIFVSCPDLRAVTDDLWLGNYEPDNKKGMENCVSIYIALTDDEEGLLDSSCIGTQRYVCEMIINGNKNVSIT